MATTQDYINQLKIDKQNLVNMLNGMGVEANNNETFTSLTPKVGKIVTDPILQDKSVEITENGTTSIVADEGYDGLNKVDVTVDAIEELTEELSVYNSELTTQETKIENVVSTLRNKVLASAVLQEKTIDITENGTIKITPDEAYNGLSSITLNVKVGVQGEDINDYQLVQYLKSSSTVLNGTWIDTGIYPTNKTSVEMQYNFYQQKNNWCNLFGSSRLFLIQCVAQSDTRLIGVWNNVVSSGSNIGGNGDFTKHIVKQDCNKIYFDGVLKHTYTDGQFTDTNVLRLFTGDGQDHSTIQVYYCKIWEDGVLLRDYVPCYRKSDNVAGMFDMVENKFYENQGTVAFIVGPDITE